MMAKPVEPRDHCDIGNSGADGDSADGICCTAAARQMLHDDVIRRLASRNQTSTSPPIESWLASVSRPALYRASSTSLAYLYGTLGSNKMKQGHARCLTQPGSLLHRSTRARISTVDFGWR